MIRRYSENAKELFSRLKFQPFHALREKWREGYGVADLRADLLSGLVVSLVAVPLAMALAIASGAPPQAGLTTAVVAGFVVPLLGGSRFQVTGPTAAFVVVLSPVVGRHGFSGLLLAGVMAGVILFLMGLCRMGKLIQYIPHPVTRGFTAGIALVIATLQLKDFLGVSLVSPPESFFRRVEALASALPSFSVSDAATGLCTLALLLFWPRVVKKIPAPLAALGLAAGAAWALERVFPGFQVATIGSRFSTLVDGVAVPGIPNAGPAFGWPWREGGVGFATVEALVPAAFAIALLGAIESLLSAVVADGMGGTRHDPDAELTALGIGNILCPFFGGIPATGAIARTATNVRSGARSPLSAMAHAVFVLLAVLIFSPFLSHLPLASLAALLLVVAYHMAEVRHLRHLLRVAPPSDVLVFALCFTGTVVFDMVVGVGVGVVLAALLFMQRMASLTQGRALTAPSPVHGPVSLPPGTVLYEIAGPFFFGAVDNAVDALQTVGGDVRAVVFLMDQVPVMDVTGLVAFESAVNLLQSKGVLTLLVGVRAQPLDLIRRSGLLGHERRLFRHCRDLAEARDQITAFRGPPLPDHRRKNDH